MASPIRAAAARSARCGGPGHALTFIALAGALALGACNTPGSAGGVRPAAVTVQQGDTLFGIAQRYDVSMTALIQQNNIQSPYTIQPGQTLTLPSSGVMVPATPSSSIVASVPPAGSMTPTYPTAPVTVAQGGAPGAFPATLPPPTGAPLPLMPGAAPATGTGIVPPLPPVTGTTPSLGSGDGSVTVAPLPPIGGGSTTPTTTATAPTGGTTVASATPPSPPATSSSGLSWPVTGSTLVAYNAQTNGKANQGINIAAAAGTPVRAAAAGTVAYAGNELRGYGNLVLIRHANNLVTAYAHLATITVSKDQTVQPGQTIGTVGDTGGVSQPQLHFEVREGSTPVDPGKYLP